jgi:hypothetical protein
MAQLVLSKSLRSIPCLRGILLNPKKISEDKRLVRGEQQSIQRK